MIIRLDEVNKIIEDFEEKIKNPVKNPKGDLYTGVDLGTAFIVLTVYDKDKNPIAGAYQYAEVVRDGMVVDYMGACDIVGKLKKEIEDKIGRDLVMAAVAIPPGTESIDGGVVKNVCEACGFEVMAKFDEVSAANKLLKIDSGVIVDIGGGTTGVSILENGKTIKTIDEATGGRHLSLVLAGAYKTSLDQAENLKRDVTRHKEIFPAVSPVLDKIATIIQDTINGDEVDKVILVGGSALLSGIETYIGNKLHLPTLKPINPMFVTPIGICFGLIESCL
ncbi:ethanolamine utilization protein EutJ [uncultured Anaerococcus sp.]|uniref:ethanolamine utilization protein EutJ n=1 Tax=uncultured Anaerococcus sp. TaxID=293428 RepID=UPI002889DE27|nr:ethanolamine utilization protein EutJ [uncultured Anaerococcus sp.]